MGLLRRHYDWKDNDFGKIAPIEKTMEDGRPIFSGMFQTHDAETYYRLVRLYKKEVMVAQDLAVVQDSREIVLKDIRHNLEILNDNMLKLFEPQQCDLLNEVTDKEGGKDVSLETV